MSYLKKTASNTFFIFLASVLSALFAYLIRFLLTSNLTPGDYGLFYASLSFVGLFALFIDFGLTGSLIYHISKFKAEKKLKEMKSSIAIVTLIQFLSAFLITIFIFLYSDFFAINYLHLSKELSKGIVVLKILAIAYFVQVGFNILSAIFQGNQKMKLFSLMNFFRTFFWYSLTYLFIFLNLSVFSPALGFLLSFILVIFIFSFFGIKLIPKTRITFNKKLAKKLMKYGLPIMLSGSAGLIIGYTDTILITLFRSLEEVGIYQTAQPTARLLWFFTGALSAALFPLVTELKAKNLKKIDEGLALIYNYAWIILIPFALMAFSFSKEILNLFFGGFYAQGSEVLKILVVGAIFYSIAQINGVVLSGLGKPEKFTKVLYIGAGVNLIGNLILIPKVGIIGAAISTLLTYIIILIFSLFELKKFIKIKIPIVKWVETILSGLISLLLIYVLKVIIVANVFVEVAICFLASLLVFLILLIFLKVINLKEVFDLIRQLIRK